eukprot:3092427-Pyramimonas_sp.AAC.1
MLTIAMHPAEPLLATSSVCRCTFTQRDLDTLGHVWTSLFQPMYRCSSFVFRAMASESEPAVMSSIPVFVRSSPVSSGSPTRTSNSGLTALPRRGLLLSDKYCKPLDSTSFATDFMQGPFS